MSNFCLRSAKTAILTIWKDNGDYRRRIMITSRGAHVYYLWGIACDILCFLLHAVYLKGKWYLV